VAATGTLEAGSLDFAIVGGMELVTILNHWWLACRSGCMLWTTRT
jgi:hypothetical protein